VVPCNPKILHNNFILTWNNGFIVDCDVVNCERSRYSFYHVLCCFIFHNHRHYHIITLRHLVDDNAWLKYKIKANETIQKLNGNVHVDKLCS